MKTLGEKVKERKPEEMCVETTSLVLGRTSSAKPLMSIRALESVQVQTEMWRFAGAPQ